MEKKQIDIEQEQEKKLLSSRDDAKSEIFKACEDESINLHSLSEILKIKTEIRVYNRSRSTYYVKVSKTRGQGADGYFEISPGSNETWSRHYFHTVTIVLSDGAREIVSTNHPTEAGGFFEIQDGGYLVFVVPPPNFLFNNDSRFCFKRQNNVSRSI